jgi:hypothetical protein
MRAFTRNVGKGALAVYFDGLCESLVQPQLHHTHRGAIYLPLNYIRPHHCGGTAVALD